MDLLLDLLVFQQTQKGRLLILSLEATVAKLGRRVDELEGDLLPGRTVVLGLDGLAEGDDTLLRPHDTSLDHDKVLLDEAVVGEATHGIDRLVGEVVGGGTLVELLGTISLSNSITNAVDLLVHLGTVVVTVLTCAWHGVRHAARVPGSNTGDLTETLVGLTGKTGDSPAGDDTLESVTLGDTTGVDHLVLLEDGADSHWLLEVIADESNLVGDGSSVDLDLHDVSLLLAEADLFDLGVGEGTHDCAVLGDLVALSLDGSTIGLGVLSLVLGEGPLGLGLVPVLVEPTAALLGEVLSPDGGDGSQATGGLDVSDHADDHHGGSLDDGDSLADLLLVGLGARLCDLTGDVGHASLVASEGGEVTGLGRIVLGEGLHLTAGALAALAGKEPEGTVTGSFELTMGHVLAD